MCVCWPAHGIRRVSNPSVHYYTEVSQWFTGASHPLSITGVIDGNVFRTNRCQAVGVGWYESGGASIFLTQGSCYHTHAPSLFAYTHTQDSHSNTEVGIPSKWYVMHGLHPRDKGDSIDLSIQPTGGHSWSVLVC